MFQDSLDKKLKATGFAFGLFIFFMISFFLRLPARLPVLGAIRIDMLLVVAIFILIFITKIRINSETPITKYLMAIFIYSILVLPFVTWPGSVIGKGLPALLKAMIFFYFTYMLVLNEQRLKIIVYVFLLANTIRVIEPLLLNITQDYWGSKTSFGWDQVNRLAGGPYDVINSNGLAFVIASILPFYHYLFGTKGMWRKLIYCALTPVFLYTMALTLSRSGLLAVAIIYGVIFLKSNRKILLSVLGVFGLLVFFMSLNDIQRDRYLSIFSGNTQSSGSAEGRVTGLKDDFSVAMMKPIIGHGLGTSQEANWNFRGNAQPSHNLWVEIWQELGFIGLIIFVFYVKEIYKGFIKTNRLISNNFQASDFMRNCLPAMQVWLAMNFLFSFASYGLTSYEWYLFGGFSAVMARISHNSFAR